MTKDDIIRMAREVAGPETEDPVSNGYATLTLDELERFYTKAYAAGVKAEREDCAKVCEDEAEKWEGDDGPISTEARLCALNIRARGTS